MQRPMTSTSRSSHLARSEPGSLSGVSAATSAASRSAMEACGLLMRSRIAQADGAEAGNAVDGDDHRKGDHQHHNAQHGDGGEIAALVKLEKQKRPPHGALRGA